MATQTKVDIKDGRLMLSHSSRGTLRGCGQKFHIYKFFKHPKRQAQLAPDVGTALHIAYQDWLKHDDDDQALWELMKSYPLKLCWDSQDVRSLEAAVSTLDAMIASRMSSEYEIAQIKLESGELVPAIEVPFEIMLENFQLPNGMQVSFIGYIDAFLYSSFLDNYRAVDIKTHRDTSWDLTPSYKNHEQMVPYGIVLEHILGRQIEQFDVTYFCAFVDLMEPRIEEQTYRKTQKDIQEWLLSLIIDIRTIKQFMELGYWQRAGHGCKSFNKPCKYLNCCHLEDPDELQKFLLLDNEPSEHPWDPWVKFSIELPDEV